MAAGEGTRMRPLSERWPKPILPVDGRPVIATLLRELRGAGCERVTVVTGHLADQVEALLGDGSGFGLELAYVRQPRADGSADAVRRALDGGAQTPTIVVGADNVFVPGSVARFVAEWGSAPGALAARVGGSKAGMRIDAGLVTSVVDSNATDLTSLPLWGLGAELVPLFEGLSGPPFELKDVYERAIERGFEVRGVVLPGTRDLTRPVDLITENFSYLKP
jgi:UDP-N-acetylglucosamine diphosphorylase / glucose-1-phosphate thymidylyltransferase / UDP-N-acetylgalactosamine diphosphorylase / glucosamine-1-phosphate N-acetyltransferase / galactosamine-1-phosphate N-acetyltransferase